MGRHDRRDEIEPVRLDNVYCIGATERAIRVLIEGDEHWIPQSQITPESEVYQLGDRGTLIVTAWFARKEGLID